MPKIFESKKLPLAPLLSLLLFASCGGNSTGGSGKTITGVAAIGAPLAGGEVSIAGKSSCAATATTSSDGSFSLNVASCSLNGAILIRVKSPLAVVHSVAKASEVGSRVNITPITEVVAARALGTNNLKNITSLLDSQSNAIDDNLEQAKEDVRAAILPLLESEGIDSDFDVMKGSFAANGGGFDKVLDAIKVEPSGAGVALSLKGTTGAGSTLTFSTDINVSAPSPLDSNKVTESKQATDELSGIRTLFTNISNCMKNNNKTCFTGNYAHSSFLHNGRNTSTVNSDWWTDELEVSSTNRVEISKPVLMEMNSTRNEAHVIVKYEGYENGSASGVPSYVHHIVAKEGGSWKLKGNQLPFELFTEPTLIADNSGTITRAISTAGPSSNDTAAIAKANTASTTGSGITISIADLNVTDKALAWTNTSGYTYFNVVDNTLKPSCYTSSLYCNSYIKTADSANLPQFMKGIVKVNGTSYTTYMISPISKPSNTNSFPAYINASASLCGTNLDTSSYPSTLGFSIPTGHSVEGLNIGPISLVAGFGFNFSNFNYSNTVDTKSFTLSFTGTGTMDVTNLNTSVTSRESSGITFTRIFGCQN